METMSRQPDDIDDMPMPDETMSLTPGIKLMEITKINLAPGDVLSVIVYSNDVDVYTLDILKAHMKKIFPDNKIMLFSMPIGDKIDISVIKTESFEGYGSNESVLIDANAGVLTEEILEEAAKKASRGE
jgi:hypothetical protein